MPCWSPRQRPTWRATKSRVNDGTVLLDATARGVASPASFARIASHGRWELAPHLALLNYYLLLCFSGKLKRLMIAMPPRHGKSEFISHYFPAWWLGCRPHDRVLAASYEAEFAATWGRLARNTLEEWGPSLFGVHVAGDSRATNRWDISGTRGGMVTAGVGGPLTGRGGNLLLLDDPIKNDAQANSPTYRENAWQWWRATYRTRLQKNGVMVHVQTRWHEDDLAGRILQQAAETGEEWTVLSLPAIATEDEELPLWTRSAGEPLWPEMYDREALEALKADVGSYWWASLYQQTPQPAGGGLFKRQHFRYWHGGQTDAYTLLKPEGPEMVPMQRCRRFLTVDVAASVKASADYTVVAAWAVTPQRDLILLDIQRLRMEGPDQPDLIRGAFQKWKASQVKVESVAYQLTLVQSLRRQGLPVVELRADKDKVSRALTAAARFEGGNVYLPQFADWLGDYEAELLAFPRGEHDDQVDATAYACIDVAAQPMQQLVSW